MEKWNDLFIEPEREIRKEERQNASYLRRLFTVNKPVESAVLKITACGIYKAFINGNAVDNQVFLPGFTYYKKRLQYQSYDVTGEIHAGDNVIGAVLGDGWYRGRIGLKDKTYYYGDKVKLLCVLTLKFKDGTTEEITTDSNWRATQNGPIRKNDLKTGEEYDATMEMAGWNKEEYDDKDWHEVYPGRYDGQLVEHRGEAIIEQERFTPSVLTTPDGSTVLDFGQNLSGYVSFKVTGKEGHRVKLTHCETLDEYGNFTLKNLQLEGEEKSEKPFGQMINYTLKEGTQQYKPTFSQCGFQYVKVENWPEKVRAENFEAIAVYSDISVTGTFRCSNDLVNKLVENLKWSQRSNFVDIPTDCPTRERAGWTGDISIFAETACYVSDPQKFLLKWMEDLVLLQKADGNVPFIVPDLGMSDLAYGSAGWADAIYNVPFVLYQFYGKTEVLEKFYDNIKCWVEFNRKRATAVHPANANRTEDYRQYILDTGFHFGEWLEPGSVMTEDGKKAREHPDDEVATAYYGYSAKILATIAEILGKKEDAKEYQQLFEKIRNAYQQVFIKNGTVISERQCRYVRPIMLDMITDEQKKKVASDLNDKVIGNNFKIGTGFLTTSNVLSVLTDYGYVDTAYKMLENTEQPGWLYAVTKGATTIWENWFGKDENNVPIDSMNHYAPGSVVAWLFSTAAGIKPMKPGFEKIKIAPIPGGTLAFVEAEIDTCQGKIQVEWKIEDNKFLLKGYVPAEAEIRMPDGQVHEIGNGNFEFVCG